MVKKTSKKGNTGPIEKIFCAITFLFCTVLLILNAVERADSDSDNLFEDPVLSAAYNAALLNLNSNPISVIDVQNSDSNCTGDINILFTWETVKRYCDCGNTITRQTCPRGSSCKNSSKKAFSMSNWKGKMFCINRLLPEEWRFSTSTRGSCPDNFRSCSGGICVSNSITECPITDLLISDTNPSIATAHYKNISNFADSRSVFISRDKNKTPLIDVIASVPDIPCIDVKVGPKRTIENSFPIIEIEPKGCNATRDFGVDFLMFFKLDELKEWSFYEENINMDYFLSLPGYNNFVGDEKITLFSRRKIEFQDDKLSCGSFNFGALTSFSSDLKIFNALRFGTNLTVLIFASISIVLIITFTILLICLKSNSWMNFHMSFLYLIFSFLMTFIIIIIQGIANNYRIIVDSNSDLFISLADSNCFKVEAYNRIFQEMKTTTLKGFDKGKAYNSAGLGLSITYLTLLIIYSVLMLICACRKKKA